MRTEKAVVIVLSVFVVFLWLVLRTRPNKEARFSGSSFTGPSTFELPHSAVSVKSEKECLMTCKANPLSNAYTFDSRTKMCQPLFVRKNFTLREDDGKNSMVFDCIC
ncbi:transmembrane domain-containing protein [Noumeavirus]|uniref:transmembrane domain-containing protein n=1 Tax=Noumeavirus TaxID=1955558 RepID=UPI000982C9A4|nr:transmembrane domain-containing protein [Noumeavirus]AQM73101.1 transmembrane domain-containing protein [Noumeavirus]